MNMENNPKEYELEQENTLNLWDLVQILKANWYWFVLSVIACVGLAYLYLLQAPRVYTRSASVLIKEENRWSRARSTYGFNDLDMFALQRNVDNEVIVFKTYRLMETVARLGCELYGRAGAAYGRAVSRIARGTNFPGCGRDAELRAERHAGVRQGGDALQVCHAQRGRESRRD